VGDKRGVLLNRSTNVSLSHAPGSEPGCPSAPRPVPSADVLHHVMLREIERLATGPRFTACLPRLLAESSC